MNQTPAQQPGQKLLALLIHQVSQPLTVLLGEAELALQSYSGEAGLRAALEKCFRGLERLSNMVGNFRVLEEAERPAISTVPLLGLVEQAVEFHVERAESVRWSIPRNIRNGNVLYVRTDREVVERALSILFSNARASFVPEGKLEIELSSPHNRAVLTVLYPANGEAGHLGHFSTRPDSGADWIPAKEMVRLLGGTLEINKIFGYVPKQWVCLTLPLAR
ncbi:MAG: sensor histidine kinase [Terriglobia bacterium]